MRPSWSFVVTDLVGQSLAADDPLARQVFGFRGRGTTLDFMDWNDCHALVGAGMTIGSHARSHPKLAEVDAASASAELAESRAEIEAKLGVPCMHFCAPYGQPGTHFDSTRDPELARAAGYRSFATGVRGPSRQGDDPLLLRRDHLLAGWGEHQLRYFLSLP